MGAMAPSVEKPFHQRFCRAENCGAMFFICAPCDRGQRYCSKACQQQARRQQWREASCRYQQSPEGRLGHRDRQRVYRQRKAEMQATQSSLPSVTHQSSQLQVNSVKLEVFQMHSELKSTLRQLLKPQLDFKHLICQVCSEFSRFVNPFNLLN